MLKRMFAVCLIGLTAPSCASGPIPMDSACVAFGAIRPEAGDVDVISESLTDQILIHNDTGQRLCHWKP